MHGCRAGSTQLSGLDQLAGSYAWPWGPSGVREHSWRVRRVPVARFPVRLVGSPEHRSESCFRPVADCTDTEAGDTQGEWLGMRPVLTPEAPTGTQAPTAWAGCSSAHRIAQSGEEQHSSQAFRSSAPDLDVRALPDNSHLSGRPAEGPRSRSTSANGAAWTGRSLKPADATSRQGAQRWVAVGTATHRAHSPGRAKSCRWAIMAGTGGPSGVARRPAAPGRATV